MDVEARLPGPLPVFVLTVAGQGHEHHGRRLRPLSQLPGHFITVHARQANIEEYDLGLKVLGGPEGRQPVVCDPNRVPLERKQHAEALGGIHVVVDDKDATLR